MKRVSKKIRAAQLKASVAVNVELILFYCDIGKSIVEQQDSLECESKVDEQMSRDLKRKLPKTIQNSLPTLEVLEAELNRIL